MRVFILCTGRTGSSAFIKALQHCQNYSAGHESQTERLSSDRLEYPAMHIEADNRLSWQLALLYEKYGEDALYVHLTRNKEHVSSSLRSRFYQPHSIMDAFASGILKHTSGLLGQEERSFVSDYYVDCINSNIALFIKDRQNNMNIDMDHIERDFPVFWKRIDAVGSLDDAMEEFKAKHNRTSKRKLNLWMHVRSLISYEWKHFAMWLGLIKK